MYIKISHRRRKVLNIRGEGGGARFRIMGGEGARGRGANFSRWL